MSGIKSIEAQRRYEVSWRGAPPATNGTIAAKTIPNASLIQLHAVGHYDFLATCTEGGRAIVPLCKTSVPQDDTHRRAIEAAKAFFRRQLGTAH